MDLGTGDWRGRVREMYGPCWFEWIDEDKGGCMDFGGTCMKVGDTCMKI